MKGKRAPDSERRHGRIEKPSKRTVKLYQHYLLQLVEVGGLHL